MLSPLPLRFCLDPVQAGFELDPLALPPSPSTSVLGTRCLLVLTTVYSTQTEWALGGGDDGWRGTVREHVWVDENPPSGFHCEQNLKRSPQAHALNARSSVGGAVMWHDRNFRRRSLSRGRCHRLPESHQ